MPKITVVGLGPGGKSGLSLETLEILKNKEDNFLRTEKHPIVDSFKDWGISYENLDHFYDEAESFEEVYGGIVEFLLQKAKEKGKIVYAVPGSPLVAESTVEFLLERAKEEEVELDLRPALSFLDAIYPIIKKDPTRGLQIYDAVHNDLENIDAFLDTIVCQVYNRFVAGDLKLSLMEIFPDEYPIQVIHAAGIEGLEEVFSIPLYELDHLERIDHLTSVYIPKKEGDKPSCQYPLDPLVSVLERLLAPGGCPWDQEQTHESLKRFFIEETYEVIEAIDNKDMDNLREELGDVLLQVVFHANLTNQSGYFDMNDVIKEVAEKMIRRHPHVFDSIKVENSSEVLVNWEKIKEKEKGHEKRKSILDGIPKSLPSLMFALKIQEKAKKVGFDWPEIDGAIEKFYEELDELKLAIRDKSNYYEELGDLLFSLVNIARFLKVNPEEALFATNRKFKERFSYIEKKMQENPKEEYSLEELDSWWLEAKKVKK